MLKNCLVESTLFQFSLWFGSYAQHVHYLEESACTLDQKQTHIFILHRRMCLKFENITNFEIRETSLGDQGWGLFWFDFYGCFSL